MLIQSKEYTFTSLYSKPMKLIQENPYRILGLLVGTSAKDQNKQVNKLKMFLDAEQEPKEDYSFPILGNLQRNLEKVNDAVSKIHLNSDKMSAALFWFYEGNPITDEPAFDAMKEGNFELAVEIWDKIVQSDNVTRRNASAHHNLSTLYLSGALSDVFAIESIMDNAITLKLMFLESDYSRDLISYATDETYKITKKELQLSFLNLVLSQIEQSKSITSSILLDIINKQEFTAKDDFLKGFVQKPIEQIEKKIEEARKGHKAQPAKAGVYGYELFKSTKSLLDTIISVLGKKDLKTISISDKLANEILQCSITNFNHFHETDTEVGEISLDLNNKAKKIALGSVIKERINESTPIVERYINERPEREKIKLIKGELEFITNKLEKFQFIPDTITNARDLVDSCKPKLVIIKHAVSSTDEFYINLSSSVVQNAQNMLVQAVNEEVEELTHNSSSRSGRSTSSAEVTIKNALDTTFKLGTFDMNSVLKTHYKKNLEGIKSLARQLNISTLSPKEKLQIELKQAEDKLKEIQNTAFYKSELTIANNEMTKIMGWQFLRSESDKAKQIKAQKQKINNIVKRAETEMTSQTSRHQTIISEIKSKIKKAEY